MNEKTKFGEKVNTLTSGSKDMSEPIGVTLLPIHVAFDATEGHSVCACAVQRGFYK